MRFHKLLCVFVSLCLAAGLCGCSLDIYDDSDIMRPPRATGNKAGIQDCIEKQSNGDYTLKYPKTGDYRTAIIMKDLNNDGDEEAVALFCSDDKTAGINVLLLDEADGVWQTTASFTDTSSEIDRVIFCDINGDGSDDVIIGWSNYGFLPSKLTAYVCTDGKYSESSVEQTYSEVVSGRFTDNNFDSLMLFTLESSEQKATASLVTMNDQKESLKIASSVEMNSNVVEYEAVSEGYITKDRYGVAVDGKIADNYSVSQIIYCDKKSEIVNPLIDNANLKREAGLVSCDINHDGIIEVPSCQKLPCEEDEPLNNVAELVTWNRYSENSGELEASCYTVSNIVGGYLYTVSEELSKIITAVVDDSGTTEIYEWDTGSFTPRRGSLIMTFKRFNSDEWEKAAKKGEYSEICSKGGWHYGVKLENSQDEVYKVTFEDIQKNFILIEDISDNIKNG